LKHTNHTLVIIDDDKNLLFSLKELFTKSGYRVVTAVSGTDGLNKIHSNNPDLVICDVMMPPPNGIEVQRLLSSNPATQSIPFIFLSALSAKKEVLQGLENGADDYIGKPFDVDILLARVRSILHRERFNRLAHTHPSNWLNLNMDIREQYLETSIKGLMNALELRDHETGDHSARVVELTLRIAERVGIVEPELTVIRRGALMHDIGKLGIPDNILLKREALTEVDWLVIKKHPHFAYELLSKFEFLIPALDIPLYHHEKWNGSGYPFGVKGDAIPISARIFSIVDVWDAITNDRSYQKALPIKEACAVILSMSGSAFDPQLVPLFLEQVERKKEKPCEHPLQLS